MFGKVVCVNFQNFFVKTNQTDVISMMRHHYVDNKLVNNVNCTIKFEFSVPSWVRFQLNKIKTKKSAIKRSVPLENVRSWYNAAWYKVLIYCNFFFLLIIRWFLIIKKIETKKKCMFFCYVVVLISFFLSKRSSDGNTIQFAIRTCNLKDA